jgi:hypothetical protein
MQWWLLSPGKLKSPTSSDRSGCQKRLLLAELLVGPRKKISAWLPKAPGLHLKVRAQHGSLTYGPPFVPKVRRAQRILNQGAGSASNAAVPARLGGDTMIIFRDIWRWSDRVV